MKQHVLCLCLGLLAVFSLGFSCGSEPRPGDQDVNFLAYFPTQPGLTMVFRSSNKRTGAQGTTTITVEPREDWCGLPVIPWHFTKSDPQLYWGAGLNQDLRWMIVDPTYPDTLVPSFDSYVWAAGDKRYDRDSHVQVSTMLYRSSTLMPAYLLAKKSWAGTLMRHTTQDYLMADGEAVLCPEPHDMALPWKRPDYQGQWTVQLSTDFAVVPGQQNDMPYEGPVVVADYLEIAGASLNAPTGWIREQWILGHGIGVLKIVSKLWATTPPTREELTERVLSDPDTIIIRQRSQ
jgi:hypothetical protein